MSPTAAAAAGAPRSTQHHAPAPALTLLFPLPHALPTLGQCLDTASWELTEVELKVGSPRPPARHSHVAGAYEVGPPSSTCWVMVARSLLQS